MTVKILMTEIKLYKTTTKGLKFLGMSIPFVVFGIWMVTQAPYGTMDYIMGWFAICFFGLGIPIGLFHIFDKRPQIIINENGVWDRTNKQDIIKWEQIIESYIIDNIDQKFISIVADNSFLFKKKQYKWAAKINKEIGAQRLNLQLGQININEHELNELINTLSKANKEERKKIIQSFKVNNTKFSKSKLPKVLLYVSISFALLLLSLTGIKATMTILIITGIAASISRLYWGNTENSIIRKYARIIAGLGAFNLFLVFFTITTFNYISENIGNKISTELENYKKQNSNYPSGLESIMDNLNLNIIENYIVGDIHYESTLTDYELIKNNLFNKKKYYDRELQRWK